VPEAATLPFYDQVCMNSIVPISKACEIPRLYDMYERLLLYEALVLKTLTEGRDV
jgi:hypothetical protein